jgi:hypothetical protein
MRFPSIPLSMVGLLVLTSCDGAPVAPRTDTVEVPLNALLEESGSSAAMARTPR